MGLWKRMANFYKSYWKTKCQDKFSIYQGNNNWMQNECDRNEQNN